MRTPTAVAGTMRSSTRARGKWKAPMRIVARMTRFATLSNMSAKNAFKSPARKNDRWEGMARRSREWYANERGGPPQASPVDSPAHGELFRPGRLRRDTARRSGAPPGAPRVGARDERQLQRRRRERSAPPRDHGIRCRPGLL